MNWFHIGSRLRFFSDIKNTIYVFCCYTFYTQYKHVDLGLTLLLFFFCSSYVDSMATVSVLLLLLSSTDIHSCRYEVHPMAEYFQSFELGNIVMNETLLPDLNWNQIMSIRFQSRTVRGKNDIYSIYRIQHIYNINYRIVGWFVHWGPGVELSHDEVKVTVSVNQT